jgi:hypothetical protein
LELGLHGEPLSHCSEQKINTRRQVCELLFSEPLFSPDIQQESVPYIQMMMFGDYPPALIKRGRYSDFYFNADGMYHFY